ncbi:hypothetical protein [Planotetraspora mira]|uniref:Uncharacterized protein n=1 Tax=Planotetraspora mira TaxID=58121 RepID=A0A8J3TZW9_9ACTN|nr:hypothetical protein [Planotetraspora mira]GII33494.1 hypothetical protein Pmi06nite_69360 [Planotetraspora mira]
MSTWSTTQEPTVTRPSRLVGWGLLAGGAFFLAGGPLHPKEDPEGVSLKEHLRLMYEDPAWYPSQAILLVGVALIAASLVALARGRSLAGVPRLHTVTVIAAITASMAAVDWLLRLVSAVDADAIAAGRPTPISDVQVIMETITIPAFCLGIIALAVVGARTRALGNPLIAVPAVLGGIGHGLATATILFTDRFNPLFPAAAGIAVWAIAVGVTVLLRRRATTPINAT